MSSLFSRASVKRTRTQKNSVPVSTDVVCPPSRTTTLSRRKTRPPPLQIIPELSEDELGFDVSPNHSPATARPMHFSAQQPQFDPSRVTLSAFSFSIDDALFMFSDDAPRSPALSASSSTSGTSSEDVLATPATSDDESACDFASSTLRIRPQPISIRPLCVNKTRSLICQEDEDIFNFSDHGEEKAIILPVTELLPEIEVATPLAEETAQEFYTRELQDMISFSPLSSHPSPARRDSFTLTDDVFAVVIEVPESKLRGHSRHSKPLPLLPPVTPPASSFPSLSPLVGTAAQTSIVRRKRNIPPPPSYSPPPPPVESRPLPRMAIPLDVGDYTFPEGDLDTPSNESTIDKQFHDAGEDAQIYSQPSLAYTPASASLVQSAIPETPLAGMYDEVTLPRASTDSDAPRSSIDSTSSFSSSPSLETPAPPSSCVDLPSFFDDESDSEATERLRSRWSSSTLGSLAAEPPRTGTLLSPLRNVFGSRMRRIPLQKTPPQTPPSKSPKRKHGSPITSSSPSRSGKYIRRQGSRWSTSSAGTSSSESEGCDISPSGLKRKPIPVAMFLRGSH